MNCPAYIRFSENISWVIFEVQIPLSDALKPDLFLNFHLFDQIHVLVVLIYFNLQKKKDKICHSIQNYDWLENRGFIIIIGEQLEFQIW